MTCPHCGSEFDAPKRRSSAQNRYWHGVIVKVLAEHFGYTHDECHDALKNHFLGREDLGTGLRHIKGSSKLSTADFTRLIDEVRIWAHVEHNVYLPAPNEMEMAA